MNWYRYMNWQKAGSSRSLYEFNLTNIEAANQVLVSAGIRLGTQGQSALRPSRLLAPIDGFRALCRFAAYFSRYVRVHILHRVPHAVLMHGDI